MRRMRRRGVAGSLASVAVVVLFGAPLLLMVLGSLRPPGLAPPDGFELLPPEWRFENYRTVFALLPFGAYLANSLLVVAVAVPVTVLTASWAGFAIVTARPKVRAALVIASLIAMSIPVTALWVPRFVLYRWLGITDTLIPLMAPAIMATTPFYVLLFALAYLRIPRHLYEAAAVEGLGPFQTWRRVAFPLGRPAAFAVAMLAFIFHWANFIDPLLYMPSASTGTVPLALRELQSLEPTNHPLLLAASVMATLPAVVAFLLAQRAFFTKTLEV